ncbi:hypothetical protein L0F63_001445, partial [Massospora cicadina]
MGMGFDQVPFAYPLPTPMELSNEKWEPIDTWVLLDVLVGVRYAFQNIRRYPHLWHHVSSLLATRGIFKSHDKCRNRWKVLVAKYKRHCSQVLRLGTLASDFEFKDPIRTLLSNQLEFNGVSLTRTFKNGVKVKLAASDSDLIPLRKLTSYKFNTGDPWANPST